MYKKLSLILIIPILIACTQAVTFLGESEIKRNDDLDGFKRTLKFPTYAPFEVNELIIELKYRGPQKIEDNKVVNIEEDNKKYQTIITRYISNESPKKFIEVHQSDSTSYSIKVNSRYSEENLIKIGEELKGLYYFNGRTQMLSWEDNGTTFEMYVMVDSEEKHESEPIAKKEIFKIAESFRKY